MGALSKPWRIPPVLPPKFFKDWNMIRWVPLSLGAILFAFAIWHIGKRGKDGETKLDSPVPALQIPAEKELAARGVDRANDGKNRNWFPSFRHRQGSGCSCWPKGRT